MATHAHTTPVTRPEAAPAGAGRRSLFGAAAALLVAPAAVAAAPTPDAELIAIYREAVPLIAEYEHHTALFYSLPKGHPGIRLAGDAGEAPFNRLEELTDRAMELEASTLDGFKAKALLLQHGLRTANRMDGKVRLLDPEAELAWSLVADLLGGAA